MWNFLTLITKTTRNFTVVTTPSLWITFNEDFAMLGGSKSSACHLLGMATGSYFGYFNLTWWTSRLRLMTYCFTFVRTIKMNPKTRKSAPLVLDTSTTLSLSCVNFTRIEFLRLIKTGWARERASVLLFARMSYIFFTQKFQGNYLTILRLWKKKVRLILGTQNLYPACISEHTTFDNWKTGGMHRRKDDKSGYMNVHNLDGGHKADDKPMVWASHGTRYQSATKDCWLCTLSVRMKLWKNVN